jgi:xanthine dehydrogenase iron-sulfur cluster and FAD-binding subunit A
MAATKPLYGKEEFARRGEEIYKRDIEPIVRNGNEGSFIAIDIETGQYEIDADETAASDRLLARVPNAQTWLRRIGSEYIRRFGPARTERS